MRRLLPAATMMAETMDQGSADDTARERAAIDAAGSSLIREFHHRAHFFFGSGAGVRDSRRTSACTSSGVSAFREVGGEDFRLGLLLGRQLRPATLGEAFDRVLAAFLFPCAQSRGRRVR